MMKPSAPSAHHHARFVSLRLAAVLVVLGMAAETAVAAPRSSDGGFDLDHYLTLSTLADPRWSPDGRRLAFVVTSVDTAANATNQDIWLADLERGDVRRITYDKGDDFSPTFSPGGDTLAFLSTRGPRGWPAIYMMPLQGSEPVPYGRYAGGIGEVHWSPDGKRLAYVEVTPLPDSIKAWRDEGWDQVIEDERLQYPNLWIVDLASGERRQITRDRYIWYVRWSPDGRSLAFLVSPSGKPDDSHLVDIGVVSADGGKVRELGVIGSEFTWSPDSRWIACPTSLDRTELVAKTDLFAIPAAGGAPIDLTADFDEDGKMAVWNATSDTLFFHSAQGASTVLAAVAFDGAHRRAGPVRLLLDRHAEAYAPAGASNGRIAWVQTDPATPHEMWVAERPGDRGRAITSINAEAAALRLATTRTFEWTSTDGVRVEGLLIRPPGARANSPLPTLVDLHGGPYVSRHALAFHARPQFFAAHGYQVFMPNYRASGGYGTAFMLRTRNDWGGQDWRDVQSGIDSLVAAHLADPRRLGLYGRSYGGYLTAWGITQTDRFDAACVITGAVDLGALFGQSDVQYYRAYEFGGFPWQTLEHWTNASPITHIGGVKTPTLIVVGERDRRVPMPQAQELYQALRVRKVPVELVHYPREGHHLREPRHRADQLVRMLGWWDRWLR